MRNVTITNRKHINTSVFSPYGDSINDHINVYNLMKSHYKRIYHAKKAVNTSPPQINKSRNSLLINHTHKSHKVATDQSQKSHEVSVCHSDAPHNSSFRCSTGTLSATSLKDRQLLAPTSTASIVPGLTSSESEFFHYIVYDTKKSPSTYSEWMCQCPPSREMRNSPTNKRSPPSTICTAKAVKPKEVSPSRRKHPISRSPAPRKPKEPPDLLERHNDNFVLPSKAFQPRILKSSAQSKLRELRVYHPPRRKMKDSINLEGVPTVNVDWQKDDMSRVVWEKNKQDVTSGEDSARSSRPASELDRAQEVKETLLPKSCHCGEQVPQSRFKVSSRDSAYNGGVSSGGESRGTSPDHINMLMESLNVSEKKPQTISMSKRVDAMYAKFVNDITVDVLRRGIYTNKGLKQLFNRHIADNEGSLNKERMMEEVEKLCQDLGVCNLDEQSFVNPHSSLDTGGRSQAVKQVVCTAQQQAPNCDCYDSREHQNQKYQWYRGNGKTCECASFKKKVAIGLLSSNSKDNAHVWDDNLQDNYKVRDPKLGKLPDKFTKNVADKTSMGKSVNWVPESFILPVEEFQKADTLMSNAIMQTDNFNKSVITQTDCTPKSDVQTNTNPHLESQIYTSLPLKEFVEIDNKKLLEQIEKVIRTLHPQIFEKGCFCDNANARGVHKSTADVQTSHITLVDKATSMVDVLQQKRSLANQHDYSQESKKLMIDVGCQALDLQSIKVVKCLKMPPGDVQPSKEVVKHSKNSLVDAECQTSIEMVNVAVNTRHSKFLLNNIKKVYVKMPFTTYKLVKMDYDLEKEEADEESSLVEEVTNIPPDVDKIDEIVDAISRDKIEEYQMKRKKIPYHLLVPPQTNTFSTKKAIYSLHNVAYQTQSNTSNLAQPLSSHSETKTDQDVFIDGLEVEVEVESLDVESVDSLLILKERLRNFSMDPNMLHTSILRDQAELKPMGSTSRRT
uniref:Uncharacterized protein n=1 Tax=Timema poppense TaxID=170557 RepID=A0A7R9GYJ7_TIMPO|nr:unnamed protein product [Timema poppensis]